MCNYKNAHEDIIRISSFGEYRDVMKKVMRAVKEAYNVEKRRRQTARKKRSEESSKRTQKAKSLIVEIRKRKMTYEEIESRREEIFGRGSSQETEKAITREKSSRGSKKWPKGNSNLTNGKR